MPSSAPTRQHSTRLAWVDNLRIAAITGVIVVHTATAYVTDFADWYYDDELESSVVGLVLIGIPALLGAIFGLGPLFWLAGWFSVPALRGAGPLHFALRRIVRLGVPLAAYLLVLNPLSDMIGDVRDAPSSFIDVLGETEFGITWFVLALIVSSIGYAVLRAVQPQRPNAAAPGSRAFIVVAVLIAVLAVAVWPTSSLLDEHLMSARPGAWIQGAALFALGVMTGEAARRDAAVDVGVSRRFERVSGWLTLGGLLIVVGVLGLSERDGGIQVALHEMPWEGMVFACVYGAVSVSFTLWCLAWFARRWTGSRSWTACAGRASYGTYLLHPLVLTLVMVGLSWLPLFAPLKFVLVAVVAVPLCFLVGHAATRAPGLRRIL